MCPNFGFPATQTASKCHWYLEQITSHLSPVWYLPVKTGILLQTCCATISFRCLLLSFRPCFWKSGGRRVPAFSVSLFPRAELSGQWALTTSVEALWVRRVLGSGRKVSTPKVHTIAQSCGFCFRSQVWVFLFRQETGKI